MLKLRLIVALFLLFSGSLCASSQEEQNLDEGEVSLDDDQLDEQNSQVETENSQSDAENSQVETENSQADAENSQADAENSQVEAENSQVEAENSQEVDGGVEQNAEYSEFDENDDVDDDDRSDNGQQSIDFSQTPQDLGVLITIGDSPNESQVSRLVQGAPLPRQPVATRAPRSPPVATRAPRAPPVATRASPRAPPRPQIATKALTRRTPAATRPANCQTVCPAGPRVQFVTASTPVWYHPISGPEWREVVSLKLNLTRRSTVKLHGNGHGFSSSPGHSVDVQFFVNNQICGLHGLDNAKTSPGNHINLPLNTGAAVFHSTSWVSFQVLGFVTLDAGVHQVGLRARCRPNGRGQVNGLGFIAEIHPL